MGLDGINNNETVVYGGVTFSKDIVDSYKQDRWNIHHVTLKNGAILSFKKQSHSDASVTDDYQFKNLLGFEYTGSQNERDRVILTSCINGTVDVSDSNSYPEPPSPESDDFDWGDGSELQFEDIVIQKGGSLNIKVTKDTHDAISDVKHNRIIK